MVEAMTCEVKLRSHCVYQIYGTFQNVKPALQNHIAKND